jgi:hypothetical protein
VWFVTMIKSPNDSEIKGQGRNNDIAKLAKCIGEVGPKINEIARLTYQHKESVRYRYHKFFLDKGITIQATPSYSKLGLGRLIIYAKFADEFEPQATAILSAMSELCYLHSFTRTLLSQEYIIHVVVPKEFLAGCASLFNRFREIGLFTQLKILEFGEVRNPPMKTEYYDFLTGTWSFDWPPKEDKGVNLVSTSHQEIEKYDKLDLLILKELEIDANRTIVKMAENVKVHFKTLEFHYVEHVEKRGLIKAYRVTWPGSSYDLKLDKAVLKKHRYVEVSILFEGGTQIENAELISLLNKTPFLWCEAVGPNYWAELFIPIYTYVEFMEYIGDFAGRAGDRMKFYVMDQSHALRFTISHKLFDSESRTWRLNTEDIVDRFENLVMRTKSGDI